MDGETKAVIKLAGILVQGLRVESLEDVGVNTVPVVVSGGKLGPVKFRGAKGLEKERGAIVKALMDAGVSRTAARAIVLLHKQQPLQPKLGFDPVTKETIRTNLIRRAQYLIIAGKRLQREIDDVQSQAGGKLSQAKAMVAALAQEKRYYDLHLQASQGREVAAGRVDAAAAQFGEKLGWYAIMDDRTTRHCAEANGKNFYHHKKPAIGWPGVGGPHIGCRCRPGRPHDTELTVYGIDHGGE